MNELYLCEKPLAKTPYYLEGVSKNIYSLEELIYYLLKNVILLDRSFMSPGLCRWIGESCGYPELAENLKKKIREGCSLAEFAGAILMENGYCTRREIEDVNTLLRQMEEKSEFERCKIRADKMMENGHYISSIYEYKRMLKMRDARGTSLVLMGSVWHNLGSAYARMLLFAEAAECYEKAWQITSKKDYLSKFLLCHLCMQDEEGFLEQAQKYNVSQQSRENLRNIYRRAANTEETKAFHEKLDQLEEEKEKNRQEFQDRIGEIINDWKEDYRNFCRI